MKEFIAMSEERRRLVCFQAGAQLNLPEISVIERDVLDFSWRECRAQHCAELPETDSEQLTFKALSSCIVSKCWNLTDTVSSEALIDVIVIGFWRDK